MNVAGAAVPGVFRGAGAHAAGLLRRRVAALIVFEILFVVAVARAAAFGSKVVVLDEPTAALGVRESQQVLELIKNLRDRGIPVILISHNMPQVFEVADRIHIQRLGKRAATITPESHSMTDAVAIMTGAARV